MILNTIKALCKQQNITITELERILAFGNGTMHKWEKGQPSIDKVDKVSKYFGVSIDYLLGRYDILPSPEAKEIAKIYDGLQEEQKGLVKCYISIIKKGDSISV